MKSAAHIPGLPPPRTALIGREPELSDARHILAQSDTRLLTLTGVGGCGKTRLAVQLITDLAPDYPQGAWAVELAPVVDNELVPIVVAEALGHHESSSTTSIAAVAAQIGTRPALLLLDNCEHLIDACAAFVDTLFDRCPRMQVIDTSREPLHVAGERQYRVPPLDNPDLEAQKSVDGIATSPAVRLFVARAQAVEPSFALTPHNAATVVRICARLDGIPLAIELAAARVRVLGVEQLLERLDDSFNILSDGSRVAPTRHQTLRAALEWSDALLTEAERALFRRLAIFAGEFQIDAVEALYSNADIPPEVVLGVVSGLVDKSLVVVESDDRAARYHLLEPVRQYAFGQLEERGEGDDTRGRHAMFYLDLAERAVPELQGPEQALWLDRLEREQGNLRAALEWTRQQTGSLFELRLATALAPFWEIRGHLTEGLRSLRAALARGASENPALRARALAGAGRLSFYYDRSFTSQYAEAERLTTESLRLAREIDNGQATATALRDLAMIHRMQGDFARSIACLEEAMPIFATLNNERGMAISLLHLGAAMYMQGNHAQGARKLQESRDRLHACGHQRLEATAMTLLGRTATDRGEFKQAVQLIVEGMTMHQHLGSRWMVTFDLYTLAAALIDAGQPRQGIRFMGSAQALSDRLGSAVIAASFENTAAQVDALRQEDWFDSVWSAGYALDSRDAVQAAQALLDSGAPVGPAAEPAERVPDMLTRRELEVARLLAAGYTNREIADALFIALPTVTTHVHRILQKLELQSRFQVSGWLAAHQPPDTDAL